MDRYQVAIVIPAFNEERTITSIVKNSLPYGIPIVINDASRDRTVELALNAGAKVFSQEKNMGYEEALNRGFKEAEILKMDIVITIDADGQHNPKLIESFIKEIHHGSDFVVGIRNKKNRLSEYLFSIYGNVRFGIKDPLCGFKAYKIKLYKNLGYFDKFKSCGTALIFYAAKKQLKFSQIHLNIRNRLDNPRYGSIFFANFKILKALIFMILLDACSFFYKMLPNKR